MLPLMRELAEFEKYADAFAITEEILREQGFRRLPPDFYCLVAEENGTLNGILVYYFVTFTYRAKPNLIVKELYVAESHRSKGVGNLLMKAVAQEAERTLRHDQMVGRKMEQARHRVLPTARRENRSRLARIPNVRRSVSKTGGGVVVIPSVVEGSRCVAFKLSRRDPSTALGGLPRTS